MVKILCVDVLEETYNIRKCMEWNTSESLITNKILTIVKLL